MRRLALAATIIFAICIFTGLILGYVSYFAIGGLILAILFSRPLSDRIHLMEYPAGAIAPFLISLFALTGLVIASILLIDPTADPILRWALAALPIPALAATVFFLGRALARLDDLQRKIQAEGLAVGFGLFFTIAAAYAWLVHFGLPTLNWLYAPAAMIPCWGAGKLLVTLRYR